MSLLPAIFLDRDGVINKAILKEGKPYPPTELEDLIILPGVFEALQRLKNACFFLIVVTNQADVGRKTQDVAIVNAMHQYLRETLPLDDIVMCIDEKSTDYKPSPRMLTSAANKYKLQLSKSYMIGDRWRDINAGHAAGCTTILIDYQYKEPLQQLPHFTCFNLLEASEIILKN